MNNSYVALLRGINVGGNRKVPMADLKKLLQGLGYQDISTYINSGNAFFTAQNATTQELEQKIEAALEQEFGFVVETAVLSKEEYLQELSSAPQGWGKDKNSKSNALFVLEGNLEELLQKIWDTKPDSEQIHAGDRVIFWSIPLKDFNVSRLSKIVGTQDYKKLTIRNANTFYKIAEKFQ
ncbi:MAG: DUF1697 domain-containing protein [Micrococcaceae bacterium]